MAAEILLFPLSEEPEVELVCECGGDEFRLLSNWLVRCNGCEALVGFWNPFEPAGSA